MLEDDPQGADKRFREGCPSGVGPRKDGSHIVRSEGTPTGKGKAKGAGKGGGKKGGKVQTRLKDDKQVSTLTEALRNLQPEHGNKTLCLRYNRANCTDRNCKFTHLCAVRLPATARHADNAVRPHSIASSRTMLQTSKNHRPLCHPIALDSKLCL